MATDSNVVVDRAKSSWSDLWKKEDYWAIWLGFAILLFGFFYFVSSYMTDYSEKIAKFDEIISVESAKPIETIAFYQATDAKSGLKVSNEPGPKAFLAYLKTPAKWKTNPLDSLILSKEDADLQNREQQVKVDNAKAYQADALTIAKELEAIAAQSDYTNLEANTNATSAIDTWRTSVQDTKNLEAKLVKPYNLVYSLVIFGIVTALLFSVGIFFMGMNVAKFLLGFAGVYALCVFANIIGNQSTMNYYGLNAEVWAIVVGMLIANTIGTPKWLANGVHVEYFIKTGLVCLGAEVLFSKILAIGVPGIFVAWIVTPIVLVSTYIFGQKVLKIESKTLNMVISADMSVCGTSAAIATAAACGAKKEELTLSIGLSLTFTAVMMILLPAFINLVGMPEVLGGAWIGGTVDSTGAVAAAGALIGPKAMQVAATIKMIQNVLIGVTAFFVALYWVTKVEKVEGQKVSPMEIWHRFPKFVIGFLLASILCSTLTAELGSLNGPLFDNGMASLSKSMRSWCFGLAFLSIGLATNFRELAHYFKGGKPLILYAVGQSFNLAMTLLMAWIMFYKVFPEITANI